MIEATIKEIGVETMEKNKIKQIIGDIKFWVNDCDEKIDCFVENESWKKDKYYERLNKEDFIFVIKNKINELEKILEKNEGNK